VNLHGNPNVNRDHLITWPSGQPVHAALRDLLLESWDRTGNRYDVTHGRLAWQADGGLFVDLRLYVTKPAQEPQLWKIRFPYQADEATGARPGSESRRAGTICHDDQGTYCGVAGYRLPGTPRVAVLPDVLSPAAHALAILVVTTQGDTRHGSSSHTCSLPLQHQPTGQP
jgi:hypothetical protein